MADTMDAPTSPQARGAEKALEKLIDKKSTDKKKMENFKKWWRRRIRWQRQCKTDSSILHHQWRLLTRNRLVPLAIASGYLTL